MIKINLLPPELQGKKNKIAKTGSAAEKQGNIVIGIVGIALLVVVILLASSKWHTYSRSEKDLAASEATLKKLTDEYDKKYPIYEEKLEKYNRMKNQEEILSILVPDDRLLWAEKLQMLADLKPQDVYITSMNVTENIKMEETSQSKKSRADYAKEKAAAEKGDDIGAEPLIVKKPIITQRLTIKALSPLGDESDRINKVTEFVRRMENFESKRNGKSHKFTDGFLTISDESENLDVRYGTQREDVFDSVRVWEFELSIQTKPFGFDPRK